MWGPTIRRVVAAILFAIATELGRWRGPRR